MKKPGRILSAARQESQRPSGSRLQAVTTSLEGTLAEVSVRFSQRHRLSCRANCQQWPLLTISFDSIVHSLQLVPARARQAALLRLPGQHVVRLGAPGRQGLDQDGMLREFLGDLFRHEGWRAALSAMAAPRQVRSGTVVERLVLTQRCNQRCRFCGGTDGRDLSGAEAESILRDIQRRHPTDIASVLLVITGGEPTLSPDLPRILRRAVKMGIGRMILTTNGLRLAEAGYAAKLREAGLTHVEFAFHSHLPRVYDLITRTRGNLPKAAAGLRQALSRFEVTVNTVINRYNYARLPHFVRYLHRMRAETCGRLRLMPSIVVMEVAATTGASWEDISVPCSQLAPALVEAVRWDHAQPQRIIIEHFDGRCYAPICVGRRCPEFLDHAPIVPVTEPIAYLRDGHSAAGPVGSRVKALSCRRCRSDSCCLGVTPVYAARYGLGEFSPL